MHTQIWRIRQRFKDLVREFFRSQDYVEVDTPIIVETPGCEVHLEYFATDWLNYAGRAHKMYLRSSPELHMKRIVKQGEERIFQIAPCFRNYGERSVRHHPEFLMLEWYEVGMTLPQLERQTLEIVEYIASGLMAEYPELDARWLAEATQNAKHYSVYQAFQEFAGIELIDQDPALAAKAKQLGIQSIRGDEDFETAYFKIMLDRVEPGLAQHRIAVLDNYPPSQAALAECAGKTAKRFELYGAGVELCNGYEELCSTIEYKQRFAQVSSARQTLGKSAIPIDQAFLHDLQSGLPKCSGNALGLERLLMLILGKPELQAILPFAADFPRQ